MLAIRPVCLGVSSPVHGTWTERIDGRYPYIGGEIDDIKFGVWARCYSPDDSKDFTWMTIEADVNSGIASPPLWKNSGWPVSPIDQHQQEMLEMAGDEPESDYEPSLKDMVVSTPQDRKETPLQSRFGTRREAVKSTAAARKFSRTESMDRGVFLLKIYSPFPSRQRTTSSTGKNSPKSSVKPELSERRKTERISGSHKCWSKNINHKRRILGRLRTFFLRKSA